jgi:iron(III) transport system permease protein
MSAITTQLARYRTRGWLNARTRWDVRQLAPVVAVGAILAWLVVPPLIVLIRTSLSFDYGPDALTLEHFTAVFASIQASGSLIGNSLLFSAGSDVIALGFGILLAWISERTDTPFRSAGYIAVFLSFAIPATVRVVGWILLLAPKTGVINLLLRHYFGFSLNLFSMGGMILLESLFWVPGVFLLMTIPFRTMDPALEEAAAMSGASRWRTFRDVTMRLALPSLLSVLFLTMARSLGGFEIPAFIGIPAHVIVFPTKIYLLSISGFEPQYGDPSAYGVILLVILACLLYPFFLVTRQAQRFATVTGKGFRPHRISLGRWRYAAGAVMLLVPILVVLPTFVLIWASLLPYLQVPSLHALATVTLRNYATTVVDPHLIPAIVNTLIVCVASATGAALLTLVASWLVVRSRIGARWILEQLALVPLAVPGIVLAIAVLRTYALLSILPVYGTIWILVVAYVAAFLPFGMRYLNPAVLSLSRELEESSLTSGAGWVSTFRLIIIPLLMPALFAAWLIVFLFAAKELTIALLLQSPDTVVIGVTLWNLWQNGSVGELCAFSVVLSVVLVVMALVFFRVSRRYGLRIM